MGVIEVMEDRSESTSHTMRAVRPQMPPSTLAFEYE